MGAPAMPILRIQETDAAEVSDASAVTATTAKGRAWTARIVADVPIFVLIGVDAEATVDDLYINEFEECAHLAVSADQEVSVLGTDSGTVWVSEIRVSA